jgi:hypothetical protein
MRLERANPFWKQAASNWLGIDGGRIRLFLGDSKPGEVAPDVLFDVWMETTIATALDKVFPVPQQLLGRYRKNA